MKTYNSQLKTHNLKPKKGILSLFFSDVIGYRLQVTRHSGFTLVELLVVIGIIAVLSAVILPSLNKARQSSRDAKRVSDVKQLQLALELYYNINRSYPTSSNLESALVTGNFISKIPTDPSGGSAYPYSALGASICTSYHLGANMETANNSLIAEARKASSGTTCSGETNADFSWTSGQGCNISERLGCFDVKP